MASATLVKSYVYRELSPREILSLVQRSSDASSKIQETARQIMEAVNRNGDAALYDFALKFDQISLKSLFIEHNEILALANTVTDEEKEALNVAYSNIEKFHRSQLIDESRVETMPGVSCWRETRAIEKVGLYVPGGSAVLPSTFLMLAIPATLAGCSQIVVCSPPQKDGKVNRYLAWCAAKLGIKKIYLAGGAQAIAAMTYGTESIPQVNKIFGPGNQYVTMAKILAQNTGVAIDMPAGPSEVLVIADETANPVYVAADLLAQAEHGPDSQAVLVTTDPVLPDKVLQELGLQIETLPRKEIAMAALNNSFFLITGSVDEAMDFSNLYAPEHLLIQTQNCRELSAKVINAGSVFIGHTSPESAGDYASGTNHTLPTNGFARSYSGVSLDSFLKKITFQQITKEGLKNVGPAVETLAGIEGLQAHKNAVTVRLKDF